MSTQCSYNLRLTFYFLLTILILMHNYANGKQKLCGRVLTEVLATVCVNGFNYRIKRCLKEEAKEPKTLPPDESWYHRLKDILQKMENEPEIIEIDHANSNADEVEEEITVIGPKGIVDECCTNGCVYADILMYCA